MDKSIEDFIFEFIDQCKLLFFPEQWNNSFMEYSKNELFALLFVYRKGHANMTEIADYLGIPLNTATGIVSRLESRQAIKRERDIIDKRVVTIAICQEGKDFLARQLKLIEHFYSLLMGSMTEDEKLMLIGLVGKVIDIVSQDLTNKDLPLANNKKVKKIIIE